MFLFSQNCSCTGTNTKLSIGRYLRNEIIVRERCIFKRTYFAGYNVNLIVREHLAEDSCHKNVCRYVVHSSFRKRRMNNF